MRRHLAVVVLIVVAGACSGRVREQAPVVGALPTTTPASTTTAFSTTTTSLPSIHVSGKVTQPDGTPVARAFVDMGGSRSITGPDGWFAFETATPTAMKVSKPGWSSVTLAWDGSASFFEATISPERVRGLRVAAGAAGDDAVYDYLVHLANTTAVNAFVFDTKQEGGNVLYDTEVQVAHDIGAVEVWYDPGRRLQQAHANGLYTITRIVAFEDRHRVNAFPEEKLAGPWVDPLARGARDYNLALAVEACELGFDEIQFDYLRYPSGRTAAVTGQLDMTQDERVSAIKSFLAEARGLLHPLGCAVSAAVFGIIVSTPDDQGLGQRPEELSTEIDTLSPMVYPSHYSDGWLGLAEPNDHPYDVTARAIADALPRMERGSQLRPWLQAFWWTNDQIRSSIQAAEDSGLGWILWNVRSNFDQSALPSDDEVSLP